MKFLISIILTGGWISMFSQVKTQSLPGPWHAASTWSPVGVPTASDSVIILADLFIDVDSNAHARHVTVLPSGNFQILRESGTNIPGRLKVSNTSSHGLVNQGTVTNYGLISIECNLNNSIVNQGKFTNLDGAIIEIDKPDLYGISNEATFLNQGRILIKNSLQNGILNTGTFTNEDKIVIRQCLAYSIYNQGLLINKDSLICRDNHRPLDNNDSLINEANGVILLERTGVFHAFGNVTNGNVTINYGSIIIDSVEEGSGIYMAGPLKNFGLIDISAVSTGIYQTDSIYNYSNGSININSAELGISVLSNYFLGNEGSISISGCLEGIANRGEINVFPDAAINIANCPIGFHGIGTSNTIIQIGGELSIEGSTDIPFEIEINSVMECLGILDLGIP